MPRDDVPLDDGHGNGVRYVIRGRPGRDDRPPLAPGHPITWGELTRGSVLDGVAYPIPPFVPKRDDDAYRQQLADLAAAAETAR